MRKFSSLKLQRTACHANDNKIFQRSVERQKSTNIVRQCHYSSIHKSDGGCQQRVIRSYDNPMGNSTAVKNKSVCQAPVGNSEFHIQWAFKDQFTLQVETTPKIVPTTRIDVGSSQCRLFCKCQNKASKTLQFDVCRPRVRGGGCIGTNGLETREQLLLSTVLVDEQTSQKTYTGASSSYSHSPLVDRKTVVSEVKNSPIRG